MAKEQQSQPEAVACKLQEDSPVACPHCQRTTGLRLERVSFEAFGKPMSATVYYCVFDDYYFADDIYSEFNS